MPAPKNNHNARKADEPATAHLHMRCTPGDKAKWKRAAGRRKLAEWVTENLNNAVKTE